MSTTAINEDYERQTVYMEHLPRSQLGPINPGLHARQVSSTMSQ